MATEYIVNKATKQDIGIIGLSHAVFESIASLCVNDTENVMLTNVGHFKSPVNCKVENKHLVITVHVVVANGTDIDELYRELKEKIHYEVTQMTGFNDVIIDLYIDGFYLTRG